MEIKKEIEQDGEYQCDIDITVEEWKSVLQDQKIMNDNYVDVLLKFYAEPEHKSTCQALGAKYETKTESFSGIIINFAKASQKKINRFEVIGTDEKPSFWIIPFKKRKVGKHTELTIRPELVEAIEGVLINENYRKFKKLLEYFVAHLEWEVNGNIESRGYKEYIKPLVEKKEFNQTGQGYTGDNIQIQILEWERYTNGRIYINISQNYGSYKSRKCYLNWEDTGLNIVARWEENSIKALFQEHYKFWEENKPREKITKGIELDKLGLFDLKDSVTKELKAFYNSFNKALLDYNLQQEQEKKMEELTPYVELLESNKNLILTGAPATGKTYLAQKIAEELGHWELVQFHPSYDYTDFVEGLRPVKKEGGELGFELKDGFFKTFCKKALKNPEDDYVLIIDEINRAEISKVFGELFFSIDSGYRGKDGRVKTQYSNLQDESDVFFKGFYVPDNVYIIGTMNDIDRSVESMDFAMRRRFAWKEVTALERISMWDDDKFKDISIDDWKENSEKRLVALNNAIEDVQGLSSAYHIGPAYFLKIKNYQESDSPFETLWENHLKGVIFEYLRGLPNSVELMAELKNAYDLKGSDEDK